MRLAFLVSSIYTAPDQEVFTRNEEVAQQQFFVKEAKFAPDLLPKKIEELLNQLKNEVIEAAWQQIHRNLLFSVEHWTCSVVSVIRLD